MTGLKKPAANQESIKAPAWFIQTEKCCCFWSLPRKAIVQTTVAACTKIGVST